MRRISFIFLAGIFLAGCLTVPAPREATPATTQVKTTTSTITSTLTPTDTLPPTPTITLVLLSQIDLGAILYQAGDVPDNFAVSDIERLGLGIESTTPLADNTGRITLWIPGTDDALSVVVRLYESLETVETAYQLASSGSQAGTGLGEKSFARNESLPEGTYSVYFSSLWFTRCHALAILAMATIGWSDPSILTGYAEKLDARLAPIVCR